MRDIFIHASRVYQIMYDTLDLRLSIFEMHLEREDWLDGMVAGVWVGFESIDASVQTQPYFK